jgi:KDO2-lipid IV(A) lauroyltransferase
VVSFSQRLAWRLEAVGFDLFSALFRALPIDAASALGGWLLRQVGPLGGAHRTAERNLRIAFPGMPEAERRRLLAAQWDNVGRLFAEFPLTDRLTPASGRVEIVGGERLRALAAAGRPAVLISGHFSNWEIMAAAIVHLGVRCQVTYRAANNPHIDTRIIEARRRYGVQLLAPKGGDGSREILTAMNRGESVAILNDQKFNGGVAAPFFGRPAHTAPAATRLALKYDTDLIPLSVQRTRGARFRVVVHEPLPLRRTGDKTADIAAGVAAVNAFMEARVRERPHEWFWVHKRWPAEAYAALEDIRERPSP